MWVIFIFIIFIIFGYLSSSIEYFDGISPYIDSPYLSKMTKKKGESCEYPTECESLSCVNNYTFQNNKIIEEKKCF
jgi:hypothetical protein